ncbi:UNVERIFIED_CONTAM: hypothetical protein EX528_18880 [Xanthomonas axonopodis]
MSAPVNVLEIIDRVTILKIGYVADELGKVEAVLKDLFEKGRALSADLEHAIAISNVSSPDAVHVRHPIRLALDQFDEALRAAGGAV